jgi:hypothetical protein
MTRLLTIATLVSLVALPAALAVPSQAAQGPAQQCRQLQSTMNAADFASAMGATANPKAAFGKCVAMKTRQAEQHAQNAAKQCRAEQANATKFANDYGQGKNAFGKCVSSKAKQAAEAQQTALLNAAKACKAERADPNFASEHEGKSFRDYYGTNVNKANAFGKCVSAKAKAKQS